MSDDYKKEKNNLTFSTGVLNRFDKLQTSTNLKDEKMLAWCSTNCWEDNPVHHTLKHPLFAVHHSPELKVFGLINPRK
jgi:hypothetical protein